MFVERLRNTDFILTKEFDIISIHRYSVKCELVKILKIDEILKILCCWCDFLNACWVATAFVASEVS